jgi:hypothetical protein
VASKTVITVDGLILYGFGPCCPNILQFPKSTLRQVQCKAMSVKRQWPPVLIVVRDPGSAGVAYCSVSGKKCVRVDELAATGCRCDTVSGRMEQEGWVSIDRQAG